MASQPLAKRCAVPGGQAVDLASLEEWLVAAEVGARIDYAWGCAPPRDKAAWARARQLSDEGEVRLHQRREGGRTVWFAVRRVPPVEAVAVPPAAIEADEETVADAVLRIIRRAARLGRACPTNGEIGRELDMSAEQAAYRFRCLKDLGRIRVDQQGFGQPRVVAIVGTRLVTSAGAAR